MQQATQPSSQLRAGAAGRGVSRPIWLTLVELAPVTLVLGFLFGGACLLAVAQSLGFAPWFGINTFPDSGYFAALWGSSTFWSALGLTLYYGVVSTAVALGLALLLAQALVKSFPGRTLYRFVYKLPLMIPYTVGIALAVIMMGNGGVMSRLAAALGLISDPAEFPRLLHTHSGWGIIAVYVWKQTPFIALAVYAVLLGNGQDKEEAAAILGASRRQIFFGVTLPQIMPGIVSATLICFSFNIGAFEAPFILGGGFPDTLPVMAWRYFSDANYNLQAQGMATVVSIGIVAGIVLVLYLTAYRNFERRRGRV